MKKLATDPAIKYAVAKSGLENYSGSYLPLGGGEVNDSYLLDLGEIKAVLRVSRDVGIDTLENEARALSILNLSQVPRLLYFDKMDLIQGKHWILESYVAGTTVARLSPTQFHELGKLLAQIHNNTVSDDMGVNAWDVFVKSCRLFGDEAFLLSHPDERLRSAVNKSVSVFKQQELVLSKINPVLIHSDATPSNILVDGDNVNLIDWEFAKYSDPMAEFSTIFYEDIDYNQGKWRIKIDKLEKAALYEGYQDEGGVIDSERIKFWMMVDKIGAAVFLYWRLNDSGRELANDQIDQYKFDYENILSSLDNSFIVSS